MKKFIVSCVLLICIALSGCSGGDKKIPDDLVVVLPDGKEIYLYMPHDDAAEVLGPSDEAKDEVYGSRYIYNDLKLWVMYTDNILTNISLMPETSCKLKNELNPASKKSDFINADFNDGDSVSKYYNINNGIYTKIDEQPSSGEFQEVACIYSRLLYNAADKSYFKGYPLDIVDYYCAMYIKYD